VVRIDCLILLMVKVSQRSESTFDFHAVVLVAKYLSKGPVQGDIW